MQRAPRVPASADAEHAQARVDLLGEDRAGAIGAQRRAVALGVGAYTLGTLREGRRPWLLQDPPAFQRSLRQLQAYDRQNPDALIAPGHDLVAWEGLCGEG